MFLLAQRINRASHYWTTCGWSDRARNARHYLTSSEARVVFDRMTADGLEVGIVVLST